MFEAQKSRPIESKLTQRPLAAAAEAVAVASEENVKARGRVGIRRRRDGAVRVDVLDATLEELRAVAKVEREDMVADPRDKRRPRVPAFNSASRDAAISTPPKSTSVPADEPPKLRSAVKELLRNAPDVDASPAQAPLGAPRAWRDVIEQSDTGAERSCFLSSSYAPAPATHDDEVKVPRLAGDTASAAARLG